MGTDFGVVLGLANEAENGGAGFVSGGSGGGREFEGAVRKSETIAEGAVGAELNFPTAERYPGVGFGGAVDDQLGVDVKPELVRSGRLGAETRNPAEVL